MCCSAGWRNKFSHNLQGVIDTILAMKAHVLVPPQSLPRHLVCVNFVKLCNNYTKPGLKLLKQYIVRLTHQRVSFIPETFGVNDAVFHHLGIKSRILFCTPCNLRSLYSISKLYHSRKISFIGGNYFYCSFQAQPLLLTVKRYLLLLLHIHI